MVLGLSYLVGFAFLVCFILVVVKMFQNNQTGLAIVCIVLYCCAVGWIIAFVNGWMNAGKWGTQTLMMIWTACLIAQILLFIIGLAMGVAMIPEIGQEGWFNQAP